MLYGEEASRETESALKMSLLLVFCWGWLFVSYPKTNSHIVISFYLNMEEEKVS